MDIHEVYYSPMNTVGDDERKDWEDMYIKKYLKDFGSLPPNNHQNGRQK